MKYTDLEDLKVEHPVESLITDIDRSLDNWVEVAAEKTQAVRGSDTVKLDCGVLSVNQINQLLANIDHEVTTCDANNQYLFYNRHKPKEDMVAKRNPEAVGEALFNIHPERVAESVAKLIYEMRTHQVPRVVLRSNWSETERFVTHNHRAFYNPDGSYEGTMEWVQDNLPIVDYYCQMTGQEMVDDEAADPKSKPQVILDSRSSRFVDKKFDDWTQGSQAPHRLESQIYPDNNWLAQKVEVKEPATGHDYVCLDRGILTVSHLNHFLKQIPVEVAYYDQEDRLLYFNYKNDVDEMLNPKTVTSVGLDINYNYPEAEHETVKSILAALKNKEKTSEKHFISSTSPGEWIICTFKGIYDADGHYIGCVEYCHNILPYVNQVLETWGKKLVDKPGQEAVWPKARGQYQA
ncbi:PAS domain-containing protein [Aerococcus urinae]|uniref:PAS domain-containing protein n=3 Tax=Aerococcus urinae TaxID=1376 RepID=A0A0X8FD09_9LACT|nr:PAS domain-containing protein [Aerococcus urinae]AMB95088.1 hypothetical protein AWM73_00555 [Aerococcus urinae]MCY3031803.1 PAS domain-containing protein [Aerococcus urinae]MCY3037203.1 PAS domain-containing protein [Aerococcus urinae]MCY3043850.1 PAS domain-containing protein [Aerococcus urinae]MCY3047305.1 PAS domain-containing protein [Aerococcus urinae]